MRLMRTRSAALVIMLMALVACSSSATSSTHYLTLPTSPSSHQGIGMNALLTGKLMGRSEAGQGRACLWIGSGSDRAVLLWPSGYVAVDDPLRVLDRSKHVVGQVGAKVSLGGGGTPLSQMPANVQACGDSTPMYGWIVAPTMPGR
jgi:hypothetical protein